MVHAKVDPPNHEEEPRSDAFDLEQDEHYIRRWRHLVGWNNHAANNSELAWWMVVYKWVAIRRSPSLEGQIVSGLSRGDPIFCVSMEGAWIRIDLSKVPPASSGEDTQKAEVRRRRLQSISKSADEAWMMWDGHQKGFPVLLQPVALLDRLVAYRHSDVTLPREAVLWTISEVDIYLGSLGFIRPSRESSLMRSSKRLVRALRGGYKPLEFRVDQSGKDSGVFSSIDVEKGDLVELCPLHEVPAHLRAISKVLQRITVPMQCDASRFAIVLGFGKVYGTAQTPNLHWSYRRDDEVVLWAAEDILGGRELTVDFNSPPKPLELAGTPPSTWQKPPQKPGRLANSGFVVHGESSIHGRGVFTTKDAAAGDLLESCPAVLMDEGAAEAMFSYRWGLKNNENSKDYYLPLGLGSLYNHSESPNAAGQLDVKRSVLEFRAVTDLYKGQEVFVSYGDSYFDEDYEGHRRSELLHVDRAVQGDRHTQQLVECQRALVRAFEGVEFQKELKDRAMMRARAFKEGRQPSNIAGGKRSVHALIMEVEEPILERYGYARGFAGARAMEQDLLKAAAQQGKDSEIIRNNAHLGHLLHRYDPPPDQYRRSMQLQLTILGAPVKPNTSLSLSVPVEAPCGFVRFILYKSMGKEVEAHSQETSIKLVHRNGFTFQACEDWEPLPDEKLYISGLGDELPADARSFHDEFELWQVVNAWLSHAFLAQCFKFTSKRYTIAGTWDDFKGNEMQWDGANFFFIVSLSAQEWDSFQILEDGSWERAFYPSCRDGSPFLQHHFMGPNGKGHGHNWTIGRHENDAGKAKSLYKVELCPDSVGRPGSVTWRKLRDSEMDAIRAQAKRAKEELRAKELQQCRSQAEVNAQLRAEYEKRRYQSQSTQQEMDALLHENAATGFDFEALEREEASEIAKVARHER